MIGANLLLEATEEQSRLCDRAKALGINVSEHRCSCEICATSSWLCTASMSSLDEAVRAAEQDSLRRLGGDNENTNPLPTERNSGELGIGPGQPSRGLSRLSTERLIAFAWSMADLIDASVYAGEKEEPWRTYARTLEKQAHAEVSARHRVKGAAE